MNVKCPSCGLTNFADSGVCRRCQSPLVASGGSWVQPDDSGNTPQYGGGTYGTPQPPSPSPYGGTVFGEPGAPGPVYPPPQGGTVYGAPSAPGPSYPPYGGPQSGLAQQYGYGRYTAMPVTPSLAGRGRRLAAAIIDGLCLYVPLIIGGSLAGGAEGIARGANPAPILLGLLVVLVIGIVQLVLLTTQGQTLGKMALNIRIVLVDSQENGGFLRNVLLRSVVPHLIGIIPIAGLIFTLVDVLCIFRVDHRCIHDMIAGTMVVDA
jgi:uncharacterized RDD family membrane protein YckC